MSFAEIAEMAADDGLYRRVQGCVADMALTSGDMWAGQFRWQLAAGNQWQTAWGAAAAAGTPLTGRGWLPDVITDDLIRQRVQRVWDRTSGGN